jgi:hypothetical protein
MLGATNLLQSKQIEGKALILILVLALCSLFILSCEDDSNPTGTNSNSTSTITGKIDNWTGGTGKTIRAVHGDPGTSNYPWCGSSPIAEDGSFSITMGTPPDSMLDVLFTSPPPGVNVSDPTAKGGGEIEEFVISPSGYAWRESSTTYTFFSYCDKNVNVTGYYSGITFDLHFVKGWNQYAIPKSDSGSISSTEPADTKWIYMP